jgi:hypothetical protein
MLILALSQDAKSAKVFQRRWLRTRFAKQIWNDTTPCVALATVSPLEGWRYAPNAPRGLHC